MGCKRCQGLCVREAVWAEGEWVGCMRCVNCGGVRFDPVRVKKEKRGVFPRFSVKARVA